MTPKVQDGAALVLALLPTLLSAQTINLSAPVGAQIFQQIQVPSLPQPPSSTSFSIEQVGAEGEGAPFASSDTFLLQRVEITHNTLFDTAVLHALVADAQGKPTTLTALNELAARITHFYRSHGYPLSRAIVPAQSISLALGVVSIRVVEASYDRIELDNTSRVRSSLLQATLTPLLEGHAVDDVPLNNVLLLLSDMPGTDVTAIYKPGQRDSTSTLTVAVKPSRMVSGNVMVDNFGTDETGLERLSSSLTLANPFKQGDTIQVSTLSSGGGLNHWRLAYEATLNGMGTRAGASFSSLDYALGGKFASMNASGWAQARSLWVKHPLVRSPARNLYAQVQYDGLQTHDRADDETPRPDRALHSATLSLTGDAISGAHGEGITNWKLAWTDGRLRLADDALTPGGKSGATPFAKWNLNLTHLQRLRPTSALYLSYSAQRAQSTLDPSQKLSTGGPYTVRAYPTGTISGDSGQVLTAEWREELGDMSGHSQAVAFIDRARVTLSHASAAADNVVWLRGYGLGLNWMGSSQWTARATVAKSMGTQSSLVIPNSGIRTWLEVRKAF